jgi:hypothetical protein
MNPESNNQDNIFYLINLPPNKDEKPHPVPDDAKKTENILKNKKIITAFLKNENTKMAHNIIDDQEIFSTLTNEVKLVLSELLAHDKITGQEYIGKILDNTDDELTLAIVKNKVVYNFLNRNNKIKLIDKLLQNPWLPNEEASIILDIIRKTDRNILDNLNFPAKPPISAEPENMYREHSSESNEYFYEKPEKKRNKYDDYLSDY